MSYSFGFSRAAALLMAAGLGCILPIAGCGSNLPATKVVAGTVTYQGQPVEGATVLFSRGSRDIAQGELAIGKTDASGRFALTTHMGAQTDVAGAPVGDYDVTISKFVPPPHISEADYQKMVEEANKIGETGAMVPPDKEPPELVELFPPQYSMASQSALKASVTQEGPNDFQFDLQ